MLRFRGTDEPSLSSYLRFPIGNAIHVRKNHNTLPFLVNLGFFLLELTLLPGIASLPKTRVVHTEPLPVSAAAGV